MYIYNPASRTKRYLDDVWEIMKFNAIETKKNINKYELIGFEQQLQNLLVRNAMTSIANLNKKGHPSRNQLKEIVKTICNDQDLIEATKVINRQKLNFKRKILLYLIQNKRYNLICLLIKVSGD